MAGFLIGIALGFVLGAVFGIFAVAVVSTTKNGEET